MTREEALIILNYCDEYFHIETEYEAFCMARNALKERPHGEWENCGGIFCARCSVCKEVAYETVGNFCPNCGADMRGDMDG